MIVAIEGIDGSGKSTQVESVVASLRRDEVPARAAKVGLFASDAYKAYKIVVHRLRDVDPKLASAITADLVVLETARTIYEDVIPAHTAGEVVVCDRYLLGGLAYLGSRGLSCDAYLRLRRAVPEATVTVFLELPFDTAMRRCEARDGPIAPQQRQHMFAIYEGLCALRSKVHCTIDATVHREVATETILRAIRTCLATRPTGHSARSLVARMTDA